MCRLKSVSNGSGLATLVELRGFKVGPLGPEIPFLCHFSQPYWQCQKDPKLSIGLYSKKGKQVRLQTTKRGNQIKRPTLFLNLLWKCAILQKHQFYRKKKNENLHISHS